MNAQTLKEYATGLLKEFWGKGTRLLLLLLVMAVASGPLHGQERIIQIEPQQLQIGSDSFKLIISEETGRAISHNTSWEIILPEQFLKRKLNFVRVHFCKDAKYLLLNDKKLDENGAYLSFSCHNSEAGTWHQWSDQFGPEKFATVGNRQKLNRNIFGNVQTLTGDFPIDKVRLTNIGRGKTELAVAQIYYLEFFFLQPATSEEVYGQTFQPSSFNGSRARYDFDKVAGKPMNQGEKWCLLLPGELTGRQINYIVMKFRQPLEKLAADGQRDSDPAYLLVQAHDQYSGFLWPWYDRYGTEKYVEPRAADDPENENLHDCLACMSGVKPDKIVLTNVGSGAPEKSKALMYGVEVVFFPDLTGTITKEMVFTPGTRFPDPEQGLILPEFGGGPRFGGKYPEALMIGVRRHFRRIYQSRLPEIHRFLTSEPTPEQGFIDGRGRFFLNLPGGKKLRQIEIAAGDVDNTVLETNKDAHFGRLGWSELYLYLHRAGDQKMRPVAAKANVGPEGIIAITPDNGDLDINAGDRLVIESRLDVGFIMGLRLTLTGSSGEVAGQVSGK